jgi:mannosyltransferase OCH1-like enzyme
MEKKVYFYWGGDKMPLLNAISIISFREHNPEYKVILYKPTVNYNSVTWDTSEQKTNYIGDDFEHTINSCVDEIRYINMEDLGFSNQIHHAQKADILRQWLLLNEGGWWSDMDIVWVRSISSFMLEDNFDLGVCWRNGYHNSGVMYSRPNTIFYNTVYNELKTSFSNKNYQSAGPSLLNQLFPGIEVIEKTEQNINVYNFAMENFAPLDSLAFHLLYKEGNEKLIMKDNVYGVHWYNGGSESGNFVNSFNAEEIANSPILMYKLLNSTIGSERINSLIKNEKTN